MVARDSTVFRYWTVSEGEPEDLGPSPLCENASAYGIYLWAQHPASNRRHILNAGDTGDGEPIPDTLVWLLQD